MNIKSNDGIKDQNIRLWFRPEYLTVNADMAIRVAKDKENGLERPLPAQCNWLTGTEINLTDGPTNLIKLFGIGGISLLAVWQNRLIYNQSNMLGRMHLLYKTYNNQVASAIGISIKDIYIILLSILLVYQKQRKTYFKKGAFVNPTLDSLTEENIENFLFYFARKPDEYKTEAKREKIYENSFGKFKYLIRYPIIKLEDDLFIIPVFEQLIDTVANNLYFLLLEHFQGISKKSSKTFLDNFGDILENYVLDLTAVVFGKEAIVRADKIVPTDNEFRCEAVAYHQNHALAIEVKKMNFKRDAISDKNKEHIDAVLENHLVKAFQQIENTLNYVTADVHYGITVVPDIMLSLSAMIDYMRIRFKGKARFDDKIFICTLSWYEALMANEVNIVFEILNKASKRESHEGNDIIVVIQDMRQERDDIRIMNQFLSDASNEVLATLQPRG